MFSSKSVLVNGLISAHLLDLSVAFDIIENILLQRLDHLIGVKGTTLNWVKSYLSEQYQFVHVTDKSSIYWKFVRIPLGSVLGQIQYTLYMLPLGNIGGKHIYIQYYADDTQLYFFIWSLIKLISWLNFQAYLKDVKDIFLLLNLDKTNISVLGPKHIV